MLLTKEDCTNEEEYSFKYIVLKDMQDFYSEKYRTMEYQVVYCTGGNGASPDHAGTGVFFTESDGQRNKVDRAHVLGVLSLKAAQAWVKLYADNIQDKSFKNGLLAYALTGAIVQ